MQGERGRGRWIAICALAAPFALGANAQSAAADGPPLLTQVAATAVSQSTATLKARIDPAEKVTTFSFEYGPEDCEASPCAKVAEGSLSVPTTEEVTLKGLDPGTLYHYRVTAENSKGKASSGDRVFATRSAIFSGLPDNRAYEQASPTGKDGGDLQGYIPLIKAAESGGGITFESTFGVPGGKGAQEFPTYFASRGQSSWSTEGLLPPFSAGQLAQVMGWSPDFTEVFSKVFLFRPGEPRMGALVMQKGSAPPVTVAPYTPKADYFYAGQSEDGSVVIFESLAKLTPEARADVPNVYAWDRETGNLTLAGTYNDKTAPLKGALAGAYWWPAGSSGRALSLGGAERSMYLRDEHAVSPDGSVIFTEAATGQLYRRVNPTAEQSPLNGQGECEDPAKACTIHISASHKTDGKGEGGTDAAGPQAAAFQAASKDGSEVLFTSPEKLTDDANTGPEQSPAQIEEGNTSGAIENEKLVPTQRALGVAVDSEREHLYWVDPATQVIDRSDLDGTNKELAFVTPGPIECEVKDSNPPKFEKVESTPRYLAVQGKYIYWTNTGCSDEFGPLRHTGTIGRADISGAVATDVDPAFIEGASDPQGIAVNSEHIYWANAGGAVPGIGWATLEGEEVDQELIEAFGSFKPYGVALSSTHVYFSVNEENEDFSYMKRALLGGGGAETIFVGKKGLRGVAVDSEHVYWASQGEEAIGRADLELTPESREKEFIPLEGKPTGIAVQGTHLYWSTNGELPTNPGNDLYRYGPGKGELEDLTPDQSTVNGAEVQGVLGASADGSYVYFAANGVLDDAEEAKQGDCKGSVRSAAGSCSLYLRHDGATSLIARLRAGGSASSDALDWAATPLELFGTNSYVPKTSFVSADGQTLLFRSQEQLTPYANEETPELYRFRVGDPEGIRCVTCNPAGEAPKEGPGFGRLHFPALGPLPSVTGVSARVLSADGEKAFFETTESLVPEDTDAQLNKCENVGKGEQLYYSCIDTYEWEATGAPGGSCSEGSPGYSPINAGCVYLISTGKSRYPSLFADASASGDDVYFFSREQLVGQDKDEIQDVYDARVGGGLASQSPVATVPCEGAEACHGPAQAPPVESTPATPSFHGPVNPKPKHPKPKHKKKKHDKKKKSHNKNKKNKRAGTEGRSAR